MDKIAVIDFGGQYAHLITNRIRRLGVLAEVLPSTASLSELKNFKGVILSGGPSSVYGDDAPEFNEELLQTKLPLLGICYGHQLLALKSGGKVSRGQVHEFGPSQLKPLVTHPLFKGVAPSTKVWMSHGDEVSALGTGFEIIGSTSDCQYAAVANDSLKRFGIQFHPEVTHSEEGEKIFKNFIELTGAKKEWDMKFYFESLKARLIDQCKGKKVFLLVSGGVDSTVAFALLNQVLGAENVMGLHIDNGLMRKDESKDIIQFMNDEGFHNLKLCEAQDEFLSRLKGVTAPEEKRKIIGDTFLDVLDREVSTYQLDSDTWILAQGTTYPDTIESGGTKNSATIKTHHNRVPAALELLEKGLIIEPLAELYKDEVRELGENLGIPKDLVWRHPFPGPGLGVRLLCRDGKEEHIPEATVQSLKNFLSKHNVSGEVVPIKSVGVQGDARTYAHPALLKNIPDWELCDQLSTSITNKFRDINRVVVEVHQISDACYVPIAADCNPERLKILQEVDDICTKILKEYDLYNSIWQMPVVLLPLELEGQPVVVMRPIESAEAMTANFTRIDFSILNELWNRLVPLGVGALWYDVTHKPPGTIEWE